MAVQRDKRLEQKPQAHEPTQTREALFLPPEYCFVISTAWRLPLFRHLQTDDKLFSVTFFGFTTQQKETHDTVT